MSSNIQIVGQVFDGILEALNRVTKFAEAGIAIIAQPTSKLAGLVVVIQVQFSRVIAAMTSFVRKVPAYRSFINRSVAARFCRVTGPGQNYSFSVFSIFPLSIPSRSRNLDLLVVRRIIARIANFFRHDFSYHNAVME